MEARALLQLLKRPKIAFSVLAIFLLLAAAVFVPYLKRAKLQHARELIPLIEKLAEESNYFEAFDTAVQAEKDIKNDSTLISLMPIISDDLTIITQPEGANVYLKRFDPDEQGQFPPQEFVGITPIHDLRLARGNYRVSIEKEGFSSFERIVSSELSRVDSPADPNPNIRIEVALLSSEELPVDMTAVPGGRYQLVGLGAPTTAEVQLDDFFIDKYEVSNAQFKEFILAGGYSDKSYWQHPFVKDGRIIPWNEAMQIFTDRTGLAGPRDWVNQEFPEGRENHPVTGVCWYEAAAFAEFVDKKLPTIFQWEKAARDGAYTHREDIVMPWGLVRTSQTSEYLANFNGPSTTPVDGFEFGISPYGCYNMAGNVKEWCMNEITGGYVATGGSWEDPMYLFAQFGAFDGFFSSVSLGFRCVRNLPQTAGDQGAFRISIEDRTPSYFPVDEQTFKSYLSHYSYDKKPIDAEVIEVKEDAAWTREKVIFNGPKGEDIIAYLYLPRQLINPLQCMIFVPGGGVFFGENLAEMAEWALAPQIKSGRALLTVVLKGMTERAWDPDRIPPATDSVQFRDEMVLHATELRMGIDYLETRNDIDMSKLAYVGLSWGAGSRLGFAALDPRFRTVVFIGGGIDERLRPTLPEADNVNFAPYIKQPKLLVNGRYDEEHTWFTRALPLYNLLREPKKLVLLEGGHIPSIELRAPAISKWLDDTLGPVKFE